MYLAAAAFVTITLFILCSAALIAFAVDDARNSKKEGRKAEN